MQLTPVSGDSGRLQELHRWLTLEGSTCILGGTGFYFPMGIVFLVLKWGAILFTPFMLWRLYQLRKTGWIIGFVVFVGTPLVASFFLPRMSTFGFLTSMMPLVVFYLYTWILRFQVGEWLEELRWKQIDRVKQKYRRY